MVRLMGPFWLRADRTLVASVIGDGLTGLSECERSGLLRADGEAIAFYHELQRRAVEASLRPEARRRLNARILEALVGKADASVVRSPAES